ncbi:MAG TPA: GNAT family N-acetyltransferase [Myxococcales bacterium]|jgi:GNAT superfamily N-acetyltransferase|nr:GNAT family N-acetyltransferase [Myxococcales bacterium]
MLPPGLTVHSSVTDADWRQMRDLLALVGMGHYAPELHQRAFENSFAVVFLREATRLVAMGRAISDGAYQAGLYDIAVHPHFQGRGLGRFVLRSLLSQLEGMNVILYASPGVEPFYEKEGFRGMRTGMIRSLSPEKMYARGFID